MNLFTSSMYNFAILCPYKITYLLHSIFILPSKYILRWKYILRNKNQLNLCMSSQGHNYHKLLFSTFQKYYIRGDGEKISVLW